MRRHRPFVAENSGAARCRFDSCCVRCRAHLFDVVGRRHSGITIVASCARDEFRRAAEHHYERRNVRTAGPTGFRRSDIVCPLVHPTHLPADGSSTARDRRRSVPTANAYAAIERGASAFRVIFRFARRRDAARRSAAAASETRPCAQRNRPPPPCSVHDLSNSFLRVRKTSVVSCCRLFVI